MDLSASQLRYWEKEFALLKPKTNARGKRFYHQSDIEVIEQILFLNRFVQWHGCALCFVRGFKVTEKQ